MKHQKQSKMDQQYFEYIDELEKMDVPMRDLVYNFPVFVGAVNIARELFFYECYKKVLGFDWFQGMQVGEHDMCSHGGKYKADYDTLKRLMEMQGVDDVAQLYKMDVTTKLEEWISERPWIMFKLVFIDCGIEQVLDSALRVL